MGITALNNTNGIAEQAAKATPFKAQQDFSGALKDAINKVNEAQISSDQATEKMVNGENVDLHTVMVASQKASISMSMALEVRNKAVEAYQEMMRMSI
ncbi:flagellar hook-basal body complex protein FliE [Bacillus massiliglaciei]|uniref:flagellar hook-basal body complex protein FliE n=1 Tax=Bacillus massiliglaciei TaxID=1816693 RepID=UPI000DA5F3D4|nr:flagellar hook-basal body complex protein FliE [Bacillus massiliglaciei]